MESILEEKQIQAMSAIQMLARNASDEFNKVDITFVRKIEANQIHRKCNQFWLYTYKSKYVHGACYFNLINKVLESEKAKLSKHFRSFWT